MDADQRTNPPYRGNEKETQLGFLRFMRQTVVMKCHGLTEEQMRATPTASSMTLLGMVKHLTIVERYWFRGVFLDADVDLPWSEEDPDGDWRHTEADSAAAAIADYLAECKLSDAVIADHGLDELAAWAKSDEERVNLRYILTHLIEETARHCGHADIIRESIDGVTGE
jgi:uncharacterized damage-inducible protein DinB